MNNVETLKKYKEMLDNNIITQEEFDKKKHEILDSKSNFVNSRKPKKINLKINKKIAKLVVKVVAIIAIIVGGYFGFTLIKKSIYRSNICDEFETNIKSLMSNYGISTYKVKPDENIFYSIVHYYNCWYKNWYEQDVSYDVYIDESEFNNLSDQKLLSLLIDLDEVEITNPNNGTTRRFDYYNRTRVHPGLNIKYSYWRYKFSILKQESVYRSDTTIMWNKNGSNDVYYYSGKN